jgi:hypothetical protein
MTQSFRFVPAKQVSENRHFLASPPNPWSPFFGPRADPDAAQGTEKRIFCLRTRKPLKRLKTPEEMKGNTRVFEAIFAPRTCAEPTV